MYETTCPQCHMANASSHNYCGRCGAALDNEPIVVSESKGLSVGGMNLPARQLRQIGFSVLVSAATLLAEVGVIYLNRRVQQMRRDSAVVPLQRGHNTSELLPSAEEPAVADMSNSILFNQTGQIIYGNQINAETIEQMGNIGDTIQVENGDFVNGDKDTYTFTGNMQGAMININAHLENVQQTIQALPHGTSAEKEELQAAVTNLQAMLDRVPDAHAQAAELIATRLEQLLLEIEDEEPDPISIESKKDRLLNAAEQIVNVATRVLPITEQIIHLVGLVVPLAA